MDRASLPVGVTRTFGSRMKLDARQVRALLRGVARFWVLANVREVLHRVQSIVRQGVSRSAGPPNELPEPLERVQGRSSSNVWQLENRSTVGIRSSLARSTTGSSCQTSADAEDSASLDLRFALLRPRPKATLQKPKASVRHPGAWLREALEYPPGVDKATEHGEMPCSAVGRGLQKEFSGPELCPGTLSEDCTSALKATGG